MSAHDYQRSGPHRIGVARVFAAVAGSEAAGAWEREDWVHFARLARLRALPPRRTPEMAWINVIDQGGTVCFCGRFIGRPGVPCECGAWQPHGTRRRWT